MAAGRGPVVPTFLQRLSTDEYPAPALRPEDRRVARSTAARVTDSAGRLGSRAEVIARTRLGTAAGLRELNREWGEELFAVPAEAVVDAEAAREAFASDDLTIDVQTHFVAPRPGALEIGRWTLDTYRNLMPDWWTGLDGMGAYSMAEYLRCVFLESETDVAVLTSGPGLGEHRMLFNDEIAGAREMVERLGASGRLLNHAVVHPNVAPEMEAMERWRDEFHPVGWKVYTLGQLGPEGFVEGVHWWLDDEATGIPFLQRARDLDVRLVCAHKGISSYVPAGAPTDVGPAAAAFPDLDFVIYHSGYETPDVNEAGEGPYDPEHPGLGVDRLIASLAASGIGHGGNVYAELGTTWFSLIRRPVEAAHVLGKLLLAVGEDNVIWGSDGIWYGPPQPAVDAFRAFQIPEELRERHGYPELTPRAKAKILGLNAARVYGIDPQRARAARLTDELAWARAALAELDGHGDAVLGAPSTPDERRTDR